MTSLTGLSPNNPLRYEGAAVAVTTIVTRNRAPTGADYRQPETGKLYPFGTLWLIGKDPTTGVQGDLWYLSKIAGNVGYWLELSNGGSGAVLEFVVDAATAPGVNPVVPSGGSIDFNGAVVANHSVPVETRTRALNAMNVEVQYSASAAATDGTKSGLAHYNSAQFTVDASGFVSLAGSGTGAALKTLTGDSGGAISGDAANNINVKSDSNFTGLGGTGIIVGTANTLTLNLTAALSSPTPIGNTTPSSGRFTGIGVGLAAPGSGISLANTNGILFNTPSGASGGSSVSNTITIFENGTYEPTIFGVTTAGAGVYSAQYGSYTRVGNLALVSIWMLQDSHTGTGYLRITLPFTSLAGRNYSGCGSFITQPAGVTSTCSCTVGGGDNSISMRDTGGSDMISVVAGSQYYTAFLAYLIA